ncbi:MAG: peptidylprolyl isomerase [Sphingomonas sp.]
MTRRLFIALLVLLGWPALAQPPATTRVILQTSEGNIVLELETQRAPVTAANFLRYVDQRQLDGTEFYRAMRMGENSGLIQGGIRDSRLLHPPIAHEPTSQTGITHVDGSISMARLAPGSAQADFFITVGPVPGFDAGPLSGGDQLGFAAFGRVVEGMDVVRRIWVSPTSPTEGVGVMRGQMLSPRIRLITARRATPAR